METSTITPVTPSAVGMRYGLLTGLVSIILSFALFATDLDQSPLRWLGLLVVIGGMVLAQRYFKQQNGGFMAYSQGLITGFVLSGVSGILSTLFTYLYMTFIDPEYMSRVMDTARAKMEAQGKVSDAQIEQATAMMQKFGTGGWLVLFGMMSALVFGLLIALVVSAIIKNPKPEFE